MVDINGVSSLYGANGEAAFLQGPLKEFLMTCGVFCSDGQKSSLEK